MGLILLWVLCGMGGFVLGRFQSETETKTPPIAAAPAPAPEVISPMRVTVIETIQNSATVLVYLTKHSGDLMWLKATADGTSLTLRCGELKKTLEFAAPIVISHSEYVNHAQENAPTLVLEILFNADMDTL